MPAEDARNNDMSNDDDDNAFEEVFLSFCEKPFGLSVYVYMPLCVCAFDVPEFDKSLACSANHDWTPKWLTNERRTSLVYGHTNRGEGTHTHTTTTSMTAAAAAAVVNCF